MDWDLHHRNFLVCFSVICPKLFLTETDSAPARIAVGPGCPAHGLKPKQCCCDVAGPCLELLGMCYLCQGQTSSPGMTALCVLGGADGKA